ncbi:MAG: transcription termination factor NusA [Clostridiales bacterium]|jgi:N utilization substance protein A|nr:transcription termination factor NusA [Clostridiales bacterium]
MVNKDFFAALEELEREKHIKKEIFIEALETALAIAYKKHSGTSKAVSVKLSPKSNTIRIVAFQTVVETAVENEGEISLEDARLIDKKYKAGDIVSEEVFSKEFGRIAAQTAKQVIMQKLREVESENAINELSQKEDELVACIVRRIDGKNVYVEINRLEAVLMPQDQSPLDRFNVGDRIKVYVKKIKTGPKGPQIIVSRTVAGFVKRLFELEVPEIASGQVVIKAIVREAGYRTKMAVWSGDSGIDPVGACVGNRGMRVHAVVAQLDGEKIDIVQWDEDSLEFIARALSPAKVVMVQVNDEERSAKAIVMDEMLSLAIGRDGQNARLAARLTGWKIDVKPYSSLAPAAVETDTEGGEHVVEDEPIIVIPDPAADGALDIFDEDLGELD